VRKCTEDPDLGGDVEQRVGGRTPDAGLQLVEDHPVPDLLRLPDVGVEHPVHLGRVRQQRDQLEDVAVHLELDACHVVEDVAVALFQQPGIADRVVDGVEIDRRVLGTEAFHVLDQSQFRYPGRHGPQPSDR
jgi:hypothetical protein